MTSFDELPEKIRSRLVGALNLANMSTNPGEAANASARVQEMLLKYNISLASVSEAANVRKAENKFAGFVTKNIVFGGMNRDISMGNLAGVLSKYMFVKVYWSHVQDARNPEIIFNTLEFVGRDTDVQMVMALFDKLRFALNKMANYGFAMYKRMGGNVQGKRWKDDFMRGAIYGISQQLEANYEEFKRTRYMKLDGEITTSNDMALTVSGRDIILSTESLLEEFYNKILNGAKLSKIGGGRKKVTAEAYLAGIEAGKNMPIHDRIK